VWGLLACLNWLRPAAHRVKNNRPVVGFLNPLLYQIFNETNGAAFNDIVEGNNRCTEGGCLCHTGFEVRLQYQDTTAPSSWL